MITFLTILHISVSIFLILVVLLQTGKGAEMGAAFGGSSQAVFGAGEAASGLRKATTIAAVIFMFTSLGLTILGRRAYEGSVIDTMKTPTAPQESQTPSAPAPSPTEGTTPEKKPVTPSP